MKIYLDNCALGRLFDEESQLRIRTEAAAVRELLRLVRLGQLKWVSSTALQVEVSQNTNAARRRNTQVLLTGTNETLRSSPAVVEGAALLQAAGFARFDAQHLAFAAAAKVDAFLTTDDRLLRRAKRLLGMSGFAGPHTHTLVVANPVDWLRGFQQ